MQHQIQYSYNVSQKQAVNQMSGYPNEAQYGKNKSSNNMQQYNQEIHASVNQTQPQQQKQEMWAQRVAYPTNQYHSGDSEDPNLLYNPVASLQKSQRMGSNNNEINKSLKFESGSEISATQHETAQRQKHQRENSYNLQRDVDMVQRDYQTLDTSAQSSNIDLQLQVQQYDQQRRRFSDDKNMGSRDNSKQARQNLDSNIKTYMQAQQASSKTAHIFVQNQQTKKTRSNKTQDQSSVMYQNFKSMHISKKDELGQSKTDGEQCVNMMNSNQTGSSGSNSPEQNQQRGNSQSGNGKKKTQPHQPRNREGGTSGRNGRSANSLQEGESHQQSNQSSSSSTGGGANNQNEMGSDQFSQLVCQVPQGQSKPMMSMSVNQQQTLQVNHHTAQVLLGPQREKETGRKTLVLDLDETLVHSSFNPVENAHIQLPVEIDGKICTIYVLVRPYVSEFLKRMHKIFELVIFTASLSKYAEPLMQQLDPCQMCSYLLFREHCTFFNNAFVKDLTRLGRSMKDVLIVDNSPVAYLFQPENAIPIPNWYDDPRDQELPRIANLLEKMVYEEDVRKIVRTIVANNAIDPRQEQLYLASRTHRRDKSQRADRRIRSDNFTNNTVDIQQVKDEKEKTKEPSRSQGLQQSENQQMQRTNNEQEVRQSQQFTESTYQSRMNQNIPHSRYDSSDTRTKHAALITAQIEQSKHEHPTAETFLQNQTNNPKFEPQSIYHHSHQRNMAHSSQATSQNLKKAYENHKTQIMQLKNEIAALKGQQDIVNTSSYLNDQSKMSSSQVYYQRAPQTQTDQMLQNQGIYTQQQKQIYQTNQPKSPKTAPQNQQAQSQPRKSQKVPTDSAKGKDNSKQEYYKDPTNFNKSLTTYSNRVNSQAINTSNIQFLNQNKITSEIMKNQQQAIDNADSSKNSKQIIKLVKKLENQQNPVNSYQNFSGSQQVAQDSRYMDEQTRQQQHPFTAKNQAKQHFDFYPSAQVDQSLDHLKQQIYQEQDLVRSETFTNNQKAQNVQVRQQSAKPHTKSSSSNHGTSSQIKQNSSVNNKTSQLKSSGQGQGTHKHVQQIQTNVSAHDKKVFGQATSGKRSSSVKNSTSTQQRASSDVGNINFYNMSKKHAGSTNTTGYSNIATYELHQQNTQGHSHQRRERGRSAQPTGSSTGHLTQDPRMIMTNLGGAPTNQRSSSTNRNKKSSSFMGTQNLMSGSQSTKHSSHTYHIHPDLTQAQSRNSQAERHSSAKNQSRNSSKQKMSSYLSEGGHKGDRRYENPTQHKSHSGMIQDQQTYYSSNMQRMLELQTSFSATQKLSPSAILGLSSSGVAGKKQQSGTRQSHQGLGIQTPTSQGHFLQSNSVRQNLKDIQVYDMLKMTQQSNATSPTGYTKVSGGYAQSTRNSGTTSTKPGKSSAQGFQHFQPQTDDFLSKLKMQGQHGQNQKQQSQRLQMEMASKRINLSDVGPAQGISILGSDSMTTKHNPAGSVLTIKSPKYGGAYEQFAGGLTAKDISHQKILNDIMNMSQVQRDNKSGSAAATYPKHQIMLAQAPHSYPEKHQIKKMRGNSGSGRLSGQSHQSAPTHQKSSSVKKASHSEGQNRGSSATQVHQSLIQGNTNQRNTHSSTGREQSRRNQMLNNTLKFGGEGNPRGGIQSLLSDLIPNTTSNAASMAAAAGYLGNMGSFGAGGLASAKNQTQADIFLQAHQKEQQFAQTSYFSQGQLLGHSGSNMQRK